MIALITGHDGFIGSHLESQLRQKGWEVHGLSLGGFTAAERDPAREPIDLRDGAALARAIELARPEVIFHLAGVSSLAPMWRSPATVTDVNCVGTVNLLEAASWFGVERLIFTSTILGYDMDTPEGPSPSSVYGASKVFGEFVVRQYRESGKLMTTSTIVGGCYGPGRFTSTYIHDLIAAAINGTEMSYDPEQLDPTIHVKDCTRYLAALGELSEPRPRYDLVTDTIKREEVVELIRKEVGGNPPLRPGPSKARPWPVKFSIAEASSDTGLEPVMPIQDGIREMVDLIRDREASGQEQV